MATWDQRYAELVEFKQKLGHCVVPQHWEENLQLGLWVRDQRAAKKKGKLPHEKFDLLNKLGFVWIAKPTRNPHAKWDERYAELLRFKAKYGHPNVPANSIERSTLARWVSNQRTLWKTGKLLKSREAELTKIGFDWGKKVRSKKTFDEYLGELVRFKTIHGHCWVKMGDHAWKDLARWMAATRAKKLAGLLSLERFSKLSQLGFSWFKLKNSKSGTTDSSDWDKMFSLLKEHKEKHGSCDLNEHRPNSEQLEVWAKKMRYMMSAGELSIECQIPLNKIGFFWVQNEFELKSLFEDKFRSRAKNRPASLVPALDQFLRKKMEADDLWDAHSEALYGYRKKHGSLAGLSTDLEARELFKWFQHQKMLLRKEELDKEKFQILNELGLLSASSISGRGGKRPGAGRKKGSGKGPKVKGRAVYLTPNEWEQIEKLKGTANISDFFRKAIFGT